MESKIPKVREFIKRAFSQDRHEAKDDATLLSELSSIIDLVSFELTDEIRATSSIDDVISQAVFFASVGSMSRFQQSVDRGLLLADGDKGWGSAILSACIPAHNFQMDLEIKATIKQITEAAFVQSFGSEVYRQLYKRLEERKVFFD